MVLYTAWRMFPYTYSQSSETSSTRHRATGVAKLRLASRMWPFMVPRVAHDSVVIISALEPSFLFLNPDRRLNPAIRTQGMAESSRGHLTGNAIANTKIEFSFQGGGKISPLQKKIVSFLASPAIPRFCIARQLFQVTMRPIAETSLRNTELHLSEARRGVAEVEGNLLQI